MSQEQEWEIDSLRLDIEDLKRQLADAQRPWWHKLIERILTW